VDNHVREERLKAVVLYLSKAPPEVAKPIILSLTHVSDAQLQLLREWIDRNSAQQLRELTVQNDLPFDQHARDALLLAWLGHKDQPPALETALLIAAAENHLSAEVKLYALEQLAQQAARGELPRVAAAILERAAKMPNATWGTLTQLVDICRVAREYGTAVNGVRGWIRRECTPAKTNSAQLEEALDLEVQLLLEANRAEEALSGTLEALTAAGSDALPERTLDRAWTCAVAARQTDRLIPWMERYLKQFRESLFDWNHLLGQQDIDSSYRRWLLNLARVAEGHMGAERLFYLHLRLAACGEGAAVPRLCELATLAGKAAECEAFISKAIADPALMTAVLSAAQDQPLARRITLRYLRGHPQDRGLQFAAAAAEASAKPTAQSAMVWQSYLHRFPGDASAQRRLIHCHLQAHQPAMARRVMEGMQEADLTAADLRQRDLLRQF
jgi:hypothetical protein